MPYSPDDLRRFLDVATEAACAGGAVLQHYWGNLSNIQSKGRPGDLVTEADKAAEKEVLSVLRLHVPDHAILAEESGSIASQTNSEADGLLWAVDPLDGTTNYTHQYPFCGCSVGLLIDGKPAVGAIFDPVHNHLFRAAKGLGATCNREPISVSGTESLSDSLLVTGFAYDRRETIDNNYAEFCHLTHLTRGVRRGGSASIDLAYVAYGRLDGYWERGLSPWDVAAGVILVEEAGGQVTAYDQGPFNIQSGRILATNGKVHGELSDVLGRVKPLPQFAP
ncbi:MAG: inositol monophosphatase family protein [Cyanobacteria bacterium P01_F01_bin.53]